MNQFASWIHPDSDPGSVVPLFQKTFSVNQPVASATLSITALGTYEAQLNGHRIGEFILAPGWTVYRKRLQVQTYDVTDLMDADNTLSVLVGKGWYRSRMPGFDRSPQQEAYQKNPAGLTARLELVFTDGTVQTIATDNSWTWGESQIRFSEIYDGEICDATVVPTCNRPVICFDGPTQTLIPQQGEEIREQEHIAACRIFTTPKGETVVDFGQNLTGYIQTTLLAHAGDVVDLSFAEVMDKDGNFYTENYRSARAQYHYVCREGQQTYKPQLTFWGFRYIRVNQFPGTVTPQNFTAIVLHSQMKRTGHFACSDPLLNQLYSNVIWGQKGNFVDVPTDCPQRDERLGWTGDAQVFCRTACLNYDVEKFFTKWLRDMAADQHENGVVGHVIPDLLGREYPSAAWGDAAAICPWQVYLAYGDPQILRNQFDCMKKWIDYITNSTTTPNLWTGGTAHYGDWLGLDAPSGSYRGSTDEDLIASAYYAYSTSLVIKAGHVLHEDVSEYEALYQRIVAQFRKTYSTYPTQTACVVAVYFGLAENCQAVADQLADMIRACGHLKTGFVGTPYLLHVLSDYGHTDLAYDLLLRKEYPSWLYPVTKGATTIWEHWDGIMEDGGFWSSDMNSFNHYAYGSVMDWVYTVAGGIQVCEDAPGYAKVRLAPHPDSRLDWMSVSLDTRHGTICSSWKKFDGLYQYDFVTPVDAIICIDGAVHKVAAGTYRFYGK